MIAQTMADLELALVDDRFDQRDAGGAGGGATGGRGCCGMAVLDHDDISLPGRLET